MLDEMQEEEEEDECNAKRWTKKRMLDEMQEEDEEDKCRRRKKQKKNTTKLSYRSSEGRSSSRRFSKYQNYYEKTPEIMRSANIPFENINVNK